ncbi:MAG TPA: hypothetical protein VFV99_32670 [Kofleriaceae bacterium]|nr:hypothetical protein [Kofleriaceae bacterium]
MADAPPPGVGDPDCPHTERHEGVCVACGHCIHDVILNGACFLCGTTDLDPIALSPKKPPSLVPADQLLRKKP